MSSWVPPTLSADQGVFLHGLALPVSSKPVEDDDLFGDNGNESLFGDSPEPEVQPETQSPVMALPTQLSVQTTLEVDHATCAGDQLLDQNLMGLDTHVSVNEGFSAYEYDHTNLFPNGDDAEAALEREQGAQYTPWGTWQGQKAVQTQGPSERSEQRTMPPPLEIGTHTLPSTATIEETVDKGKGKARETAMPLPATTGGSYEGVHTDEYEGSLLQAINDSRNAARQHVAPNGESSQQHNSTSTTAKRARSPSVDSSVGRVPMKRCKKGVRRPEMKPCKSKDCTEKRSADALPDHNMLHYANACPKEGCSTIMTKESYVKKHHLRCHPEDVWIEGSCPRRSAQEIQEGLRRNKEEWETGFLEHNGERDLSGEPHMSQSSTLEQAPVEHRQPVSRPFPDSHGQHEIPSASTQYEEWNRSAPSISTSESFAALPAPRMSVAHRPSAPTYLHASFRPSTPLQREERGCPVSSISQDHQQHQPSAARRSDIQQNQYPSREVANRGSQMMLPHPSLNANSQPTQSGHEFQMRHGGRGIDRNQVNNRVQSTNPHGRTVNPSQMQHIPAGYVLAHPQHDGRSAMKYPLPQASSSSWQPARQPPVQAGAYEHNSARPTAMQNAHSQPETWNRVPDDTLLPRINDSHREQQQLRDARLRSDTWTQNLMSPARPRQQLDQYTVVARAQHEGAYVGMNENRATGGYSQGGPSSQGYENPQRFQHMAVAHNGNGISNMAPSGGGSGVQQPPITVETVLQHQPAASLSRFQSAETGSSAHTTPEALQPGKAEEEGPQEVSDQAETEAPSESVEDDGFYRFTWGSETL